MVHGNELPHATDGASVTAESARQALSDAQLTYDDGATQQFMADGTTVYVEAGRRTTGEWSVADDGSFSSYWPPSFRASYSLTWRVRDEVVVGLTFESQRDGSSFSGTFSARASVPPRTS